MASTQAYPVSSSIRAWSIWLLGALFMFYKNAIEVSLSVMTSTLMGAFNIGGVELGNLAASYFYAYLILQIPAGLLLDRIGPRKVTTVAISLCALGSLIFGMADTFAIAVAGRFIIGIGAAFAAINCLKLIAVWFPPRQFALMAGLMMTVAMLGAVGGQAPLSAFIEHVEWRSAMQIIGCAGLLLAAFFWFTVRDQSAPLEQKTDLPRTSLWGHLKTVLKSSQSWWLSLYSGLAFAPVMVFGGLWGVSFITQAFALSSHFAAQAVSLIFIGFAIGAPVFGWFSDRLGRRKIVMAWGTLLALLSITAVIYVPNLAAPAIFSLLFFFGFSISSFLLCFTMIRELHLPILAATAIGFMNAFDALFGAFADPFTGKILDMSWDGSLFEGARLFSVSAYQTAFLTLPIYLIIALLVLIPIKDTQDAEIVK